MFVQRTRTESEVAKYGGSVNAAFKASWGFERREATIFSLAATFCNPRVTTVQSNISWRIQSNLLILHCELSQPSYDLINCDMSKTGKRRKAEERIDISELLFGEDFKDAEAMLNAEVKVYQIFRKILGFHCWKLKFAGSDWYGECRPTTRIRRNDWNDAKYK